MGILATLLSGGMTGIFGSLIGRVFGWLEEKQKAADRREERAHELQLIELQARVRDEEAEREIARAELDAAARIREASYAHDVSGRESRWVVDVLRLVRPGLTVVLMLLVAIFYFTISDSAVIGETAARGAIIEAVLYLSISSVSWWFGDRAPQWAGRKRG